MNEWTLSFLTSPSHRIEVAIQELIGFMVYLRELRWDSFVISSITILSSP